MFDGGKLWLDFEGKIISINYQSTNEQALQQRLIDAQQQSLHSSISYYQQPILEWKTAKFHIRIDDLGDANFRYASWGIDKKTSEKPDLVLYKGTLVSQGSGGNHYYSFANGQYSYLCYVNLLGTSKSPPGTLEVFKSKKHLLTANVLEVLSP